MLKYFREDWTSEPDAFYQVYIGSMTKYSSNRIVSLLIVILLTNMGFAQNFKNMVILENFKPEKQLNWQIINDGVMGGKSSSSLIIEADRGVFSGNVSLENNGGFASTRASLESINLPGTSKIIIRVKGDGKTYQFRVRTNNRFDGIAYRVLFNTEKDKWAEHEFTAEDFLAVFRGMKVTSAPKLKFEDIQQIGFLISEKQEGIFTLKVDWIACK